MKRVNTKVQKANMRSDLKGSPTVNFEKSIKHEKKTGKQSRAHYYDIITKDTKTKVNKRTNVSRDISSQFETAHYSGIPPLYPKYHNIQMRLLCVKGVGVTNK